jgi:hypothetical protein
MILIALLLDEVGSAVGSAYTDAEQLVGRRYMPMLVAKLYSTLHSSRACKFELAEVLSNPTRRQEICQGQKQPVSIQHQLQLHAPAKMRTTIIAEQCDAHLCPVLVWLIDSPNEVHRPLSARCAHAVQLVLHVEVQVALAALDAALVVKLLAC